MTESRFSFESVRFYFLCYKFHLPQNAVYEITDQRCTDQFEQKRNDGEHDFKSKPDHADREKNSGACAEDFSSKFQQITIVFGMWTGVSQKRIATGNLNT